MKDLHSNNNFLTVLSQPINFQNTANLKKVSQKIVKQKRKSFNPKKVIKVNRKTVKQLQKVARKVVKKVILVIP